MSRRPTRRREMRGRPPLPVGEKRKLVCVKLHPRMIAKLKRLATATGRSQGSLVEDWIDGA